MKSLAISQVHFLLYCRKRMLKFFFFNYLDASLTIPLQKRFDKKVVTSFLQNLRCFKITIYVGKMRGTKPSAHFKAYSISSYFKTWYYFPPFIAITAPVSSVLKLTLMRIGYSPVGKIRPDVDFIAKRYFEIAVYVSKMRGTKPSVHFIAFEIICYFLNYIPLYIAPATSYVLS